MNLIRKLSVAALLAVPFLSHATNFSLKVNAIGADGKAQLVDYKPLDKASKDWSICVSLPHLKDSTYLAVDYGLVEEAKRLGVRIQVLDAGGYTGLNTQISQIENCVAGGAHAVVVAAIAVDGLNNLLAQLKSKGVPVVDAINGVSSKDVAGRVLFKAFYDSLNVGEWMAKRHPAGTKSVKAALLPGPAGVGFVEATKDGYRQAIKGSAIDLVEIKHGDLGKEVQTRLVEDLLQTHKDLDYIVGSAVAIEAAVPVLRARRLTDKVKLVATYTTSGVYQHLKAKNIEAASVAPVVLSSRVMLDTAVRLLEGKVEYPNIDVNSHVYDKGTVDTLDVNATLAPAGFKPVFRVGK